MGVVGALAAVALLGMARPAGAHPLGNFTVNRYARVEVSAGVLRVHYVLDLAEIPAFQEREALAADRSGYARRRAEEVAAGLRLSVDGAALALRVAGVHLSEPPGQGGLPTLRLAVTYEAPLPPGPPERPRRADFSDANEPDRPGWREVVVVARGDARLLSSDAPREDASDELRDYPADLLSAPFDRRRAAFSFVPGTRAVPPAPLAGAAAAPPRSGGAFAALVTRSAGTPGLVLGLLGLAAGFGAAHALAPGHGKTVMAAYLVGTRGRPRDAVALGVVVSLMHTASVLALGLALVALGRSVAPERIYPWLTLASGLLVTAVGAWLLARRWRAWRAAGRGHPDHHHGGGNHDGLAEHDHDAQVRVHVHSGARGEDHADAPVRAHERGGAHGGDHEHAGNGGRHVHHDGGVGHSHELAAGVAPLSRKGLVALGASGGVFPSPTAVLVLVSAFSLGRPVLGLALIAAFSVGLAATLTAVGLALVLGRGLVQRRAPVVVFDVLPLLGALALTAVGLVVVAQGIGRIP